METKTCRICGGGLSSPYRVFDDRGRIVHGCVSMDHDRHLISASDSSRWHNRKESKAIRRQQARNMDRL